MTEATASHICVEPLESRVMLSVDFTSAGRHTGLLRSVFSTHNYVAEVNPPLTVGAGNDVVMADAFAHKIRLDVYNLRTGNFSETREPFGRALSGAFRGAAVGADVYIAANDTLAIYNTASGQWSRKTLSVSRGSMAMAVVGTKLLMAGGFAQTERNPDLAHPAAEDAVDIYDTANGSFSTARLSVARAGPTAVTVGNTVIFAGGVLNYPAETPSDAVDLYNSVTGVWTTAKLSVADPGPLAAVAGDTALFLFVGSSPNLSGNRVELYNGVTHLWSSRVFRHGQWTGAFAAGGRIFVYGYQKKVQVYDPSTGQWSAVYLPGQAPPLSFGSDCIGLGDKAIFLGEPHNGSFEGNLVKIYNTRHESWSFSRLSIAQYNPFAFTADNCVFFGDSVLDFTSPTDSLIDVFK